MKKNEKTLLRFDQHGHDAKKKNLERLRRYLQAILDRWPADAGNLSIDDYPALFQNPEVLIRDRLMQNFKQPKGVPELDFFYVREHLKLPEAWWDILHHLDLLRGFFSLIDVMENLEYFLIEKGRIEINLVKLDEQFKVYVSSETEQQRLKFINNLCIQFKAMKESGLWPDHFWKQRVSIFISEGLQPDHTTVILKRDISDLRARADELKSSASSNFVSSAPLKPDLPEEEELEIFHTMEKQPQIKKSPR